MPAVKTAMTPFPYSIEAGAPVSEALEFMREHKVRHLPVTRNRKILGLITDRDIKLVLGPDFAYPDKDRLRVEEAMITGTYTVDLSTPLDIVLEEMAQAHIGSAVVTRKGELAGVFTNTDACREFARFLRERFPSPGGNEAA
ncbi:MAG: CBS domain-containing protein [Pseudomonadota bacterium]